MVQTQQRPQPGRTFRIIFHIDDMDYSVTPLPADPGVAVKAYRLKKLAGDGAVYDVYLDQYGPHCECLGFLRWQRPCKHIRTLHVAGML